MDVETLFSRFKKTPPPTCVTPVVIVSHQAFFASVKKRQSVFGDGKVVIKKFLNEADFFKRNVTLFVGFFSGDGFREEAICFECQSIKISPHCGCHFCIFLFMLQE